MFAIVRSLLEQLSVHIWEERRLVTGGFWRGKSSHSCLNCGPVLDLFRPFKFSDAVWSRLMFIFTFLHFLCLSEVLILYSVMSLTCCELT